MSASTAVIVGAGLAGARAAAAMRTQGFDGRIVLIGEEAERPYERPPLSKDFLLGHEARDDVYVHPAGFYDEQRIELRIGTRVTGVDARERTVEIDGDRHVRYDALLLATGSAARRLDIPGADLEGVRTFRTLADADALMETVPRIERAIVIGGGWIGTEIAAAIRQLGGEVTLVSASPLPLESSLGSTVAAHYRDLHLANGVDLRTGVRPTRVLGRDRVEGVELSDGSRVDGQLVIGGVGAVPRLELARMAGVAIDNGVVVDEGLATSVPGIWAVGDIASSPVPTGGRKRLEHWAAAKYGGPVAGGNMAGGTKRYERLPYFYSDQYDLLMEVTGEPSPAADVVIRGSIDARAFIVFWLVDGRVVAGMNSTNWKVTKPIEALIRAQEVVDPARLADPDVALDEIVPLYSASSA
jgi:3-phenylpropionate/trans-cinnamate dioxygenase ferredoxin reductase subunit